MINGQLRYAKGAPKLSIIDYTLFIDTDSRFVDF